MGGDHGKGQDKTEKSEKGDKGSGDKTPRKPEYDVSKKGDAKGQDKAPQKAQEKGDDKKPEQKDKPGTKDAPKNPRELDQKAKDVIKNTKDGTSDQDKAEKAIRGIIKAYYPDAKVKDVVYKKDLERGLETQRGNKDGKVFVSKDFIDNIDKSFARKVISVGHELQHIQQYKDGMNDTKDKNRAPEREFQANRDSARAPEKPGTGRMDHEMRAAYADQALKNYDKMSPDDKAKYKADADALRSFAAEQRTMSGGVKK